MRKCHLNVSISKDVADELKSKCDGNLSLFLESLLRRQLNIREPEQETLPLTLECLECGSEKDRRFFTVNKGGGKQSTSVYCRPCRKARLKPESRDKMLRSQRSRYWANREKELGREKTYYMENGESILFRQAASVNKERKNRRARDNWLENRETELERGRAYYAANPDKVASRIKEWRRRNPERIKNYWAERRVKTSGIDFSSIVGRMEVYGHTCVYCGAPYDHIDHVIPIARGGRHIAANLRPACKKCNLRKGSKKMSEWIRVITVFHGLPTPGKLP